MLLDVAARLCEPAFLLFAIVLRNWLEWLELTL
jgi:hypothetical protein